MQTAKLSRFSEYLSERLPDAVGAVPSMMSVNERRLLYGLAKDTFTGSGVIVDAGAFLGGSTRCFGEGVLANSRLPKPKSRKSPQKYVRTFERGVVNPGMSAFFERHGVNDSLAVGSSFEKVLRRNIKPVESVVDLKIGDICAQSWTGEDIEIFFLDVIKDEAIHKHVLQTFYPSLRVGSIVIQQDYFINGLPFLKVTQECLGDHFEYIGEIQSTAIFVVTKPFPAFSEDPGAAAPLETRLALMDRARDRTVDIDRQFMVELSKAHLLVQAGEAGAARTLLDTLPERFPDQVLPTALPRLKRVWIFANNAVGRELETA